jgi:hypothetical protein
VIAIVCFAVLFVCAGLFNHGNFQKRAITSAEQSLTEHLSKRGEQVEEFMAPDYSLGQIEIGIKTKTNSYYAIVGVNNSYWVEHTGLNFIIKPSIQINNLEERKF